MLRVVIILLFCVDISIAAEFRADDIFVRANKLSYQLDKKQLEARGKVSISSPEGDIIANKVEYNDIDKYLQIYGKVVITDKSGNVITANDARMRSDFASGVANDIVAKFTNNATIKAQKMERFANNITIVKDANYTPCGLCHDDDKAIWSVSSNEITIDQQRDIVEYKGATFDILGVPVFYLPYLSHSFERNKRKTGVLVPYYNSSTFLGSTVSIPLYINVAENKDFTITPVISEKEGIILQGEFRHLNKYGEYIISGSFTHPHKRDANNNILDENEYRWDIYAKGKWEIGDWDLRLDAHKTSDDSYLYKYDYSDTDLLQSRLELSRYDENSFWQIRGLMFDSLYTSRNHDETPTILPEIRYNYYNELDFGGYWQADISSTMLRRNIGADVNKLSAKVSWDLPYISESGHKLGVSMSVLGQIYNQKHYYVNGSLVDNFIHRIVPQFSFDWSYPLMRIGDNSHVIIEPILQVHISPEGQNNDEISNEESLVDELSNINLFTDNHFSGHDVLEGGARINYGIKGLISHDVADLSFMFGQSYRSEKNNYFSATSGFNGRISDYIGNISLSNDYIKGLSWGFVIDEENFKLRRSQVGLNVEFSGVDLNLNYTLVDEQTTNDKQELYAKINYDISDKWLFEAYGRRDLDQNNFINAGAKLTYKQDCIDISLKASRDFYQDSNFVEPSTSIGVQVKLKSLGF